jgi:phosphohistidine phosphatase
MNLYFIRHGDAGQYVSNQSVLTQDGIETIRNLARALQKLGIEFDQVLSSSYPRARETAEILRKELQLGTIVLPCQELTPPGDCDDLFSLLKDTHKSSVLIVGHEPFLSRTISLLISGGTESFITMKKGSVAKVYVAEYTTHIRGSLEWLLPPKVLLKILDNPN